ncbi:MAG: TlpA family protein disulfide reductase, partial [Bacteroidetes bacterium]|nr:TlpA family protein disulfide reductase [Bacteroidota bacterium]
MTSSRASESRLKSVNIAGFALLLGLLIYAASFGAAVRLHSRTNVLPFGIALTLLSVCSLIGIINALILIGRRVWPRIGVTLLIVSSTAAFFTLYQWLRLDRFLLENYAFTQLWGTLALAGAVSAGAYAIATYVLREYPRNRQTRMLLILGALTCAVAVANIAQFVPRMIRYGGRLGALWQHLGSELVGTPLRSFTIPMIGGGLYHSKDDRGKVVIYDFWATWCGPCVKALPHLQTVTEEFRDRPVAVRAVSVDREQRPVLEMIEKEQYTFSVLHDTSRVNDMFYVRAIPTTMIVDRHGIIRDVQVGFDPRTSPENLRAT